MLLHPLQLARAKFVTAAIESDVHPSEIIDFGNGTWHSSEEAHFGGNAVARFEGIGHKPIYHDSR